MARTLSTAANTAMDGWFSRFLLIQLDLDSGTERYAFASVDVAWDSQTWTAIARPVEVTEIVETDSGEAVGMKLQFKNINEAVIAAALTDNIRRKPVTVWVGAFDDSNAVVVDPVVVFKGYGDAVTIKYDGNEASVTFAIESYEALWSRLSGGRMTDQAHQARYPGDVFFNQVADAVEAALVWPAKGYFR